MKKLLALVLVLSLAATASALSGDLTGDNTPGEGSMDGSIAGCISDTYLITQISGTGTISPEGFSPIVPLDSYPTQLDPKTIVWAIMDLTPPYSYPDGVWLTLNYHDAVVGDVVTLYDGGIDGSNWVTLDSVTIVPEPMTLALLGLGSLMLLRRKR